MEQSFNRDNFQRLGMDKKNYDINEVMKYALGEHDTEDKEIDRKNTANEIKRFREE